MCQTIKTEKIKFKDNIVECSLFKYLIKSELNLVIFYIFYILCKKIFDFKALPQCGFRKQRNVEKQNVSVFHYLCF